MKFSNKLVKAKFIKRYKRFFSDHILEDGKKVRYAKKSGETLN